LKNVVDINEIAKSVLLTEALALNQFAENLPLDFFPAIKAIMAVKGRVIVSGIGKSGHVAKKIAATLASTGTPSYFVHASEAGHGDLGMVTSEDFCLLLSNSGETSELSDFVNHTRRFAIPLAVISSKPDSTLMNAAQFKLTLISAPEACLLGMAPTTSTTLMIALGDAMAVALMACNDFKQKNFKIFHPAGKLGLKLAYVEQLMRTKSEMAILPASSSMQEVILSMTETGYGVAVLTDEKGQVSGVISDGDLRRNASNLFEQDPVKIASVSPISVTPSDLVSAALNKMEAAKVYSILVVEDHKPVGLIRMHDLLRAGLA